MGAKLGYCFIYLAIMFVVLACRGAEPTPSPTPLSPPTPASMSPATPAPASEPPKFSDYVVVGKGNPMFRGGEPTLQIGKGGTLWSTDIGPAQIWKSTDGGNTWAYVKTPLDIGGADMDAAEDDAGRLHVVDQAGLDCIFYYRSSDGGRIFDVVRGTRGKGEWFDGQGDCGVAYNAPFPVDKPWVATWGEDTVYIVYAEGGGGGVDYSYDGGQTFSHTTVSEAGRGLAVDPRDGSLYLFYTYEGEYNETLGGMVARKVGAAASWDKGKSFLQGLVVDRKGADVAAGGFPAGAVDREHNVYVAWGDDSGGKVDIYFSVSKDRGRTWSIPKRVSSGLGISIYPTIAAGDAGRIAIAWYGSPDQARTRNNAPNTNWHVYLAVSTNALDETPSFQQVMVTAEPFHRNSICAHLDWCQGVDTRTGAKPPGYEGGIADFFRIALDNHGWLNLIWTDTAHYSDTPKDHFTKQISGVSLLLQPGPPALISGGEREGRPTPVSPSPSPKGDQSVVTVIGVLSIDERNQQYMVTTAQGTIYYVKNTWEPRVERVLRPLLGTKVETTGTVQLPYTGDITIYEVNGREIP